MAALLGSLLIEIGADVARMRSDLGKLNAMVSRSTRQMTRAFRGVGLALGGIFGGVTLRKIEEVTTRQQNAINQLRAGVLSTKGAAQQTVPELMKFAAAMQSITTYGDEAVMEMQAVLLTFTKISGDTFPRATKAVLDVAARMGTDLKSAALQVGKALNDPVANLGALSRAGIQFDAEQKKLIKSLWEAGRAAEAQAIILKELERQFGGSAEAARNTLGGALKALSNAFWDLFEISEKNAKPLVRVINLLAQNIGKVVSVAAVLASMALPGLFLRLGRAIKSAAAATRVLTLALASNPLGLLAVAISTAVSALLIFGDEMVTFGDTTASVLDWVKAAWQATGGALIDLMADVWRDLTAGGDTWLAKTGAVLASVYEAFTVAFTSILRDAKTIINQVIGIVVAVGRTGWIVGETIINAFASAFQRISDLASAFWSDFKALFSGDFSFKAFGEELSKGFSLGLADAAQKMAAAVKKSLSTDYLGSAVDAAKVVVEGLVNKTKALAKANAKARKEGEKAGRTLQRSFAGAATAVKRTKTELEGLKNKIRDIEAEVQQAQQEDVSWAEYDWRKWQEALQEKAELTDKIKRLTLSERDYKIWALNQEYQKAKETTQNRALLDQWYYAELRKLNRSTLDKLLSSWTDSDRLIQQGTEATVSALGDLWYGFIRRGELDFDSFVDAILDSFARMLAQMAAQIAMSGIAELLKGLFGGGSGGIGDWLGSLLGGGSKSGGGGGGIISKIAGALGLGGAGAGISLGGGATVGLGTGAAGSLTIALGGGGAAAAGAAGGAGALGAGSMGYGLGMLEIGGGASGAAGAAGAGIAASTLATAGVTAGVGLVALSPLIMEAMKSGHTKESAREYMAATLEYLQRANEAGKALTETFAEQAFEFKQLASRAEYTSEEMAAFAATLGEAGEALIDTSAATEEVSVHLDRLAQAYQEASWEGHEQEKAADRLTTYYLHLKHALEEATGGMVSLGSESDELVSRLLSGEMTAAEFAQQMQDDLLEAMRKAREEGTLLTDQMEELARAIRSIPTERTTTVVTRYEMHGAPAPSAPPAAEPEIHHHGGWAGEAIPRFHLGGWALGPDEIPAILQRGEPVIPLSAINAETRPVIQYIMSHGEVPRTRGNVEQRTIIVQPGAVQINLGNVPDASTLAREVKRELERLGSDTYTWRFA